MTTWIIQIDSDTQPTVMQSQKSATSAPPTAAGSAVSQMGQTFFQQRATYLAQLNAAAVQTPPVAPNGPVPFGQQWWYRTGFTANVPSPFFSSDMGLGVVVIWAPAGYTGAAPAADYSNPA